MDIRTAAALASTALIGAGLYRVLSNMNEMAETSAELRHSQARIAAKKSVIEVIDNARAIGKKSAALTAK